MNYLVVSDGKDYKIAQQLENHKNNLVVELFGTQHKKKVKLNQVIFTITQEINQFVAQVKQISLELDVELLAELINEVDKVAIDELADLYFGTNPDLCQKTALLTKLAENNILFYNFMDGNFRKCSSLEQEQRKQINNKQLEAQERYNYFYQLLTTAYQNSTAIAATEEINVIKLLHKPDKHSPLYKALHNFAKQMQKNPLEICVQVGLINNIAQFFVDCFLNEHNFIATLAPKPAEENITKRLDLDVFSIDDSSTTEIDDAFSISSIADGYIIGIHIAAPALDDNLEQMICHNISTLYYPGNKITMLPEEVINNYSLLEGRTCPVVSIYFKLNQQFEINEYYSNLNIVKINKNLRIENLETVFTEDNLPLQLNYPYEAELKILYQFALKLEEKRGKASVNNLFVDYSFILNNDKVELKARQRGNPIDKLVSELMILANCSWGRLLTNSFIPAIYRVKQPNYPVKMTLNPDSHTGLNVEYYTWATSPIRRATDYINQKQIISMIKNDKNFYTATNHVLLSVVEEFDVKYAKYIEFQNKMERYWSLRFLLQQNITQISATIAYKQIAQLDGVPLTVDLSNLTNFKPKGTIVQLKIFNINLVLLTFEIKIIENHE
ncbi:MAG: RNB domain-containing ribonuclease [Burkholderiales bacterium]|nr:RNB domain-containing ribonuclease [Burkholderiales bacterium]